MILLYIWIVMPKNMNLSSVFTWEKWCTTIISYFWNPLTLNAGVTCLLVQFFSPNRQPLCAVWPCCHTCGTTPKAFLHVCRETELQETPSMEMSPSVEARRSRAESRVLFPEPVRPSRPIWETKTNNNKIKISSLLNIWNAQDTINTCRMNSWHETKCWLEMFGLLFFLRPCSNN